MKPKQLALVAAVVCLALAGGTRAQMGMDYFKKPAIADIFKPVVGTGAIYETEHDQKKDTVEMSVVGRDTVDGKEAYWLEFGHTDQKTGVMSYGKMLVTKDDFQFHRMIIQPPGQPQPMEIPMNPSMRRQSQVQEAMEKWHKVGTETITVPAGTFSCDHWTKGRRQGRRVGQLQNLADGHGQRNQSGPHDASRQSADRRKRPHHRDPHEI